MSQRQQFRNQAAPETLPDARSNTRSLLEKLTSLDIHMLEKHFVSMESSYAAWRNWLIFRLLRNGSSEQGIVSMAIFTFCSPAVGDEMRGAAFQHGLPEALFNELADFIRIARVAIPGAHSTNSVFLAECGRPLRSKDVEDIIFGVLKKFLNK